MDPFEYTQFLDSVHRGAPIEKNFEVIFGGSSIHSLPFIDLYKECMEESKTSVGDWKVFRRALWALNLAKYYDYALNLEGEKAECGVLHGFSALMLAKIHQAANPEYSGLGFHLVDSFAGLSEPTEKDALGYRETTLGKRQPIYSHNQGHFANSQGNVRKVMQDFPNIAYHEGWIPDILESLPEAKWSFVHIDVDLYAPTYACLEYFVPRLSDGGVIVNDDFSSPLFPGGGVGWAEYCQQNNLHYVVLDSGQAIYIKG